jgi:hypothetical protein
VIKTFEYILDLLFDIPKIDTYTNIIQLFAFNECLDNPVVTMETGTIALVSL